MSTPLYPIVALALGVGSLGTALASSVASALPAKPSTDYVQRHPRSLDDRTFEVWRNPGRFTKNPDVIELSSGRLMLVYSDTEKHFSVEDQHLILLVSDDQGKTWSKHAVVDSHDMRKGDERLVTPRLSRLKDNRLVVLIDQDDFGHFHEDQPAGIMCYWSTDNGETWTKPQKLTTKGFEPDRMLDLPDGSLGFAAHVMRGETQEFADVLYTSMDGGKSWQERATIAHDGYHRFCEGAIVILDDGKELACVLRENHSAGLPSLVAFSKDNGHTWSQPQTLPFAIHRPYVKQLPDGRVFATGRNMLGGIGTFGWVGDLRKEAGTYQIGGPAARFTAELTPDALVIQNKREEACRYTLMPPESSKSEIMFEARVKVEGKPGIPVAFLSLARVLAFRGPVVLAIAPDAVWLTENSVDERKPVDMTQYRDIAIRLRRGLLQVLVDNKVLFSSAVFWESLPLRDFLGQDPSKRTQWGALGTEGRSHWQRVSYRVQNPTQPAFTWQWQAASNRWPDHYQRERLIQIHANPVLPGRNPDHGYSSWLTLPDGRIFLVDYTSRDDPPGKSHLVGVYINPEDLREVRPAGGAAY